MDRAFGLGIMITIPEDNRDMSDDVSPAPLAIGFVIAVALYVVTYRPPAPETIVPMDQEPVMH